MTAAQRKQGLLSGADPDPVEWVNRDSRAPILLLCEHAGLAIPSSLGDLGLPSEVIGTHIGWDIGAEPLARAMAARLDAPLILQRYSRLVIDCNRPTGHPGSVPEHSDGIAIPGNAGLKEAERKARAVAIFDPLNRAITAALAAAPRRIAFSVHTFTPCLNGGSPRPWHAGFLARQDKTTGPALIEHITRAAPDLELAMNEPYRIEDETDWFIPEFAEPQGLRHALIEVRNDQLGDEAGVDRWADLLCNAILSLPEMTL